jgi:hypothetical protein
MSCICPKSTILRTVKSTGSDRISITPVPQIANVEQVVTNIDTPVSIRLLSFHVGGTYCSKYKDDDAEKRLCNDKITDYVHFHISKENYPVDESEYLIAFLPSAKENDFERVVDELYALVQWLEIKNKINGIIFRYGKPVLGSDNIKNTQHKLDKFIADKKKGHSVITCRISPVSESIKGNRSLTISNNKLFKSIDVS